MRIKIHSGNAPCHDRKQVCTKVFFNSVNGAESSTGNFLIGEAYKF